MQSPKSAPSAAPLASSPATTSVDAEAAAVSGAHGAEESSKARTPDREAPVGGALEATPPSSPSSASSTSSTSSHPSAKLSMLPEDGDAASLSGDSAAGGCVFLRRVRGLPAVQALLGVYAGAKAYPVVGWALSVGEKSTLLTAVVCRPVALVCGMPLACADWCLCKALDVAESVMPCVSMPPSKVCGRAKNCVTDCVFCPPRAAARCLGKVCPACSQEN